MMPMVDDETDIKKKLLEELQQEMSGRRVSPILEIEISAGGGDDDGPADEMGEGLPVEDDELGEPQDVKGRLERLMKNKGMMS